jgi:mannose-P-dolichol utilization defect protein 1
MTDQIQTLILNPLKPYLSPITTNLPTPLNDALITLLGPRCHSALLLDLDIATHPECLTLAISKALGLAIIATASVVKVPQILKLIQSKSAQGVSFTSYVLETASFLITLAYNARNGFPFSTYGETALILVQDVAISILILHFSNKSGLAGAFVALVATAVYALIVSDTLVPTSMMRTLQAGAGVLSIASKLPQIITVYQQGGTGQLSAFAVFNYLAGSLSRIFTTLQEVDDKLILYGFVAGFLLNAVLAGQMLYYWNSPATAKHAGEVDEKGKLGRKGNGQDSKAASLATGQDVKRPGSSSGRRRG